MEARRFVKRLLLWILPVAFVWVVITPFYNHFLITAGENLLHLQESPDVTRLLGEKTHYAVVLRTDLGGGRRVYSVRLTDLHFHWILLGALFLAVPDVPRRERWGNLGQAVLVTIFFHIMLLFFWVKFAYATQLGEWSIEHYSPFAREFFGITKHVLDLPIKLALPLALWAAFYLRLLLPGRASG